MNVVAQSFRRHSQAGVEVHMHSCNHDTVAMQGLNHEGRNSFITTCSMFLSSRLHSFFLWSVTCQANYALRDFGFSIAHADTKNIDEDFLDRQLDLATYLAEFRLDALLLRMGWSIRPARYIFKIELSTKECIISWKLCTCVGIFCV